jgi:hypothetical protein
VLHKNDVDLKKRKVRLKTGQINKETSVNMEIWVDKIPGGRFNKKIEHPPGILCAHISASP